MSNNNQNRVLTLVVTITDPEAAKWIWEAHKKPGLHGVAVSIIANGDQVTIPGELTESLAELDSSFPRKEELDSLVQAAEQHLRKSH